MNIWELSLYNITHDNILTHTPPLSIILGANFIVFLFSIIGIFVLKNTIITIVICIELMFLSISLNFIEFAVFFNQIDGIIYGIIILTVAAAESAIGLALIISYYKIRGVIEVNYMETIKS